MPTLSPGWQEAPLTVQPRADILTSYKKHILSYLSKLYSTESVYNLSKIVDDIIKERYIDPSCTIIRYPDHGSIVKADVHLADFVAMHKADVITPAGTIFKSDLNNVPPSVEYNKQCTASRSYYKKLMFKCMEQGDAFGVDLNDKKQALRKIKNNSIIGGRGFEGNPLYDRESFGAITALGRNNVILTYTLTEQCFSNNFYWSTPEKIYDYIIYVTEHTPSNEVFDTLFRSYKLFVPSVELVVNRLTESAAHYIPRVDLEEAKKKIHQLVSKLTRNELLYLFYRRNLINLFKYNDSYFRFFLEKLMTLDQTPFPGDVQPEDALSLPGDVSMMLSIIYNKILNGKAVNKDLVKDYPDVARRFAQIGKACLKHLETIEPIMQAFMYTGELISELTDNKNIFRRTVAGSDTDSILFTMKDPVMWYLNGNYHITEAGIHFSAYLVYILSKILNIANRDLIIAKGAVGPNADEISLKSEFFYAIFIKTDIGKHYVSAYLSKEGRIQKEPKLDIKGVEFQSSTLPQASRDMAENLIKTTINMIYENGHISALDLIFIVMDYEKQILKMLKEGSLYYYTNVSIKSHAKEYADPNCSIWFNYRVWENIYAPVLGHLALPGKFPLIPFKKNVFRTGHYYNYVRKRDPVTAERLAKVLCKIPEKKSISRLPIPADLEQIPEILIPLVDMRSIIFKNVKPAQLFLRQFGIHPGDPKKMPLFLDHYHSTEDELLLNLLKAQV